MFSRLISLSFIVGFTVTLAAAQAFDGKEKKGEGNSVPMLCMGPAMTLDTGMVISPTCEIRLNSSTLTKLEKSVK